MAEGNRVRLAYRAAGSTDNWKPIRRTNDSLTAGAETTRSEEVRDDRKRGDQKIVTLTAGGGVDIEFSASSFDDFLAGAMCDSWVADTPTAGTDQLVVGTTTTKYEILKSYLDEDRHLLFKEMEIQEMSLNMEAGSRVTGQISFAGTETDTEYDPSTDTFDSAETTIIMDSSNNLSSIQIDGSALSGMVITGMTININNNHQSDQGVGTQYQEHWKGSSDITGSKTIRMSSAAYDLWKNTLTNTPISSSFTLGDGSNQYVFSVDKEFLAGDPPSGGLDSILSLELNSAVSPSDTDGETLVIERTLA